ncbi:MAG: bifunctional (p)ppGpp synthetase/guanosine-3',5'-bis(diphosphate) 3'-pyrophosphohydrolase [Bacteroidetes bacterium]|nr:MAG: bifunctional (p)ppGpp synthetase/guanosine-3',5'-bis(diphosphate) 3'-pyrophosphohydrolase [Bacteroidota bacterium]
MTNKQIEKEEIVISEDQLSRERRQILEAYKFVNRAARPRLKGEDSKLIKKAFEFALEAHHGMRRKSGEPYIFHPIEVAEIVAEDMKLDAVSIAAALLHDVVEDVETITLDDIKREFGEQVATIVDGVTKVKSDKYAIDLSISQQAENFRKMLLGLSSDLRVIYVKLADRLHNMRTLSSMNEEKQRKIASETIYIYAPLAHRLGLYKVKSELEDLHLKYVNRQAYDDIANKLQETKAARDKFVEDFIAPLRGRLAESGFKIRIFGRPKSIYSIHNKIQTQRVPFDQIYDLFAIRIIIDKDYDEDERNKEKEDCWRVYSIVTDTYLPNPERLREWITQPRPNGYESLHTTVMSELGKWVEVQIRTKRMDEIAELGYAAHWKYKTYGKYAGRTKESKTEVFVFTPKGKLIHLPVGATVIDFAFEIHSEIGLKCLGAKVNTKLVPLGYELHNGDQVEILTSKQAKPTNDWLHYAKGTKAISKIKEFLRAERRTIIEKGKEDLAGKFAQAKLVWDEPTQTQYRLYLNYKTNANVFYEAGLGHISYKDVESFKKYLDRKEAKEEEKLRKREETKEVVEPKKDKKASKSEAIIIGEKTGIDYSFAKCCNPVFGDDVFGFITIHEGIKIHRNDCPNAVNMRANYGYRITGAVWQAKQEEQFITEIKIVGNDRIGIARDVTQMISSDMQINIAGLNIGVTNSNIFEGHIKVYVRDIQHLYGLLEKLRSIEGVVKVTRYDTEDNWEDLNG